MLTAHHASRNPRQNANRFYFLYQLLEMGTTCWGTSLRRILRLHSDSAERIPWLISSRIFLGRGVCHFHSGEFVLEFHLCRLGQGLGLLLLKSKFMVLCCFCETAIFFYPCTLKTAIGIQWLVCNWLGKLLTVLCCLSIFSLPKDHKKILSLQIIFIWPLKIPFKMRHSMQDWFCYWEGWVRYSILLGHQEI